MAGTGGVTPSPFALLAAVIPVTAWAQAMGQRETPPPAFVLAPPSDTWSSSTWLNGVITDTIGGPSCQTGRANSAPG
jgi:hypothetical protein